jgi:predicted ATPase/DNA-binding SARP family transcriptional activator
MPDEPPSGAQITYRQQYRRCGKAGCGRCAGGGPGHGPYWYAQWRNAGRNYTRYLGKAAPAETTAPTLAKPKNAVHVAPIEQAPLRIQTLGGFAVRRWGQEIPVRAWEQRRIGVLFKWLLASPGHRLTRDQAVELLWPEAPIGNDAANLRVVIHRLRKALADPADEESAILRVTGDWVALAPNLAPERWLDADAFLFAARSAQADNDRPACRAALSLYTGDFLPGDPYGEWAVAMRDTLRQVRLNLLLHLADLCETAGEVEEAIGSLHLVLADDRCHEEAAIALMRLHAATGRPGVALRVYQQLAEALRDELDMPTNQEVERLADTLRKGREVPPPIPKPPSPHNLPVGLTSFVGRARELADLRALLGPGRPQAPEEQTCRLLTLIGPGGIGKTRLALALAEELLELHPDGVRLIDVSTLPSHHQDSGDPAVARLTCTVLRVPEQPGRAPADTLVAHLKEQRLLVILDNCEHLLPACAALAYTLLSNCPGLRILATSRETLGIEGEQPWAVPTLSQPVVDGGLEQMAAAEAVRLFLARARLRQPSLALTAENAGSVAAICRQLDGLPLALELAAARVGVLSLDGIATRLGDSLRLLTGGPRSAPNRQRTLRATLDWSHDLLSEQERQLLRRLAVFVGGFTLEAAQAVCGAGRPDPYSVLDDLEELARKSLLSVEDLGPIKRYRLLETVRQYAQERLSAAGEDAAARTRHAQWYCALVEEAAQGMRGPEQAQRLDQIERDYDNVRAALTWALEHDPPRAATLALACNPFWRIRGYISEGRRRFEAVLACNGAISDDARAAVLDRACNLTHLQGDHGQALALAEEALALRRRLGDRRGLAQALNTCGNVAWAMTEYDKAGTLYDESLALFGEVDDPEGKANALNNRAMVASAQGDFARASALYGECLALLRLLGNTASVAQVQMNLGISLHEQGKYEQADALYGESLGQCREMGNQQIVLRVLNWSAISAMEQGNEVEATRLFEECISQAETLRDGDELGRARHYLGVIALNQGDYRRAEEFFLECLAVRRRQGMPYGMAANLERLGQLHAALGQLPLAARLLGAAENLRVRINTPIPPREQAAHDQTTATLHCSMGDEAFAAAWNEGRAMDLDEVIKEAGIRAASGVGVF